MSVIEDEQAAPPPAPSRDDGGKRDQLTVASGLAALSLDALSSVAYGPEAIVLVLVAAGTAGLNYTLGITGVIALLLIILTVSYRQVIAAFPEGGGAYGVSRAYLGRYASLTAAASLIVDYILNVAVAIAAGVAAMTSAFPGLASHTVLECLAVLVLITAVNLRGIAESARLFIVPTVIFVVAILAVVVVGLFRSHASASVGTPISAGSLETVGILLLLKAFANGCAALTGVEAIANAVPSFRQPRVRRAQQTEVALGVLLGVMLIGLAILIEKFAIHPRGDVTVLAQVTAAALGHGFLYYVVQFSTAILLALAANTSFGGLPVLLQLLARHNNMPHFFALHTERRVHRYGIVFLAIAAGLILTFAGGSMNALVPLFAIGVFVGFTLSQTGMVLHWFRDRPAGWHGKLAINGVGAVLTGAAAIVVTATKFGEGGWLIVFLVPTLVLLMQRVHQAYDRIGKRLRIGAIPAAPEFEPALVVVPVTAVTELTRQAVGAAASLGDRVVALHVRQPNDEDVAERLSDQWAQWSPGVPLEVIGGGGGAIGDPLIDYLNERRDERVFVLIAEVEPDHVWERLLQNQRGTLLALSLRRKTDAIVCRLRFRVNPLPEHCSTD